MKNPGIDGVEQVEQRRKDLNEIAIVIDSWDDVFSDFDPSPLSERMLSEDFLVEISRRYKETRRGSYAVTIYAPVELKDKKSEATVSKRLKEHFRHNFLQKTKEIAHVRKRGLVFVIGGISFLSFLTLAAYLKLFSELWVEIVGIVLMPLGWFGIWEGFSKIVDVSEADIRDQTLYKKLSTAKYRFNYLGEEKPQSKPQSAGQK